MAEASLLNTASPGTNLFVNSFQTTNETVQKLLVSGGQNTAGVALQGCPIGAFQSSPNYVDGANRLQWAQTDDAYVSTTVLSNTAELLCFNGLRFDGYSRACSIGDTVGLVAGASALNSRLNVRGPSIIGSGPDFAGAEVVLGPSVRAEADDLKYCSSLKNLTNIGAGAGFQSKLAITCCDATGAEKVVGQFEGDATQFKVKSLFVDDALATGPATIGSSNLVAGLSPAITTTAVSATSKIFVQRKGSVVAPTLPGFMTIVNIVPGVSFQVESFSSSVAGAREVLDDSDFDWWIVG